ncbi:hypothetical protein LA080_001580 [Diaporthe eres]|uniref:C2H2-type domain-containing protein n=1 Tax=Diaporthe vaccinii TaxID=105482 RepID=A0ABR4E1A1_9PEZI|nr:hypothetical protein LA080_001580 [Diaporthe eres]
MDNFSHVTRPSQTILAFYQEHVGQSDSVVPAPPAHGKVDFLHNICADCPFISSNKSDLEQHALDAGHSSFSCICGAQFARSYCLTRHINSKIGPSFPCGLCDDKSFPRLDKLGDHLRRWHRLGAKAFDQYKGGNSCSSPDPQQPGGNHPVQAGDPRQVYPVTPGFGPVPMFNGFLSAPDTAPDASSVESNASPGSSTAADNWWCSQPGNNTTYRS